MRALPIFAAAVFWGLAAWAQAVDVNGVVTKVAGQRITLDDGRGRLTVVSVPPGTVLRVGDKVSVSTTQVGDALRAATVVIQKP